MRPALLRLAASLLVAVAVPGVAAANGLPTVPLFGRPGADLVPVQGPGIVIEHERLRLDLRRNLRLAEVEATYWMRAAGPEAARAEVAFFAGAFEEPRVAIDGRPVPVDKREVEAGLVAESLQIRREWLDPLTKAAYPACGDCGPRLPLRRETALHFSVDIPPGAARAVVVAYRYRPGFDHVRYMTDIWRYDYLLRPAARWGGFGDLEIEVALPPGAVAASWPSLRRLRAEPDGGHVLGARFPHLPAENLSLFVVRPPSPLGEGVERGWIPPAVAAFWLFGPARAALGVILVAAVIALMLRRRSPWWAVAAIALPWLTPDRSLGPGIGGRLAWIALLGVAAVAVLAGMARAIALRGRSSPSSR